MIVAVAPGLRTRNNSLAKCWRSPGFRCSMKCEACTSSTELSDHGHAQLGSPRLWTTSTPSNFITSTPMNPGFLFLPHPRSSLIVAPGTSPNLTGDAKPFELLAPHPGECCTAVPRKLTPHPEQKFTIRIHPRPHGPRERCNQSRSGSLDFAAPTMPPSPESPRLPPCSPSS